MDIHNHNLNIHYSIPENLWNELVEMFDGKLIEASLETSGLQFYAELPQEEWDAWFAQFQRRAEKILGYPIGEPEDGYEFRIYD